MGFRKGTITKESTIKKSMEFADCQSCRCTSFFFCLWKRIWGFPWYTQQPDFLEQFSWNRGSFFLSAPGEFETWILESGDGQTHHADLLFFLLFVRWCDGKFFSSVVEWVECWKLLLSRILCNFDVLIPTLQNYRDTTCFPEELLNLLNSATSVLYRFFFGEKEISNLTTNSFLV